MRYHNHRAEPYFTFLKNGQKTIEGRIRKGWYRNVQPGDEIVVYNDKETDGIETLVGRVAKYRSIEDMLTHEPIKKMLPDVNSIDEGIRVYRKFYTPEQERNFGMVAIEVKVKLQGLNGLRPTRSARKYRGAATNLPPSNVVGLSQIQPPDGRNC